FGFPLLPSRQSVAIMLHAFSGKMIKKPAGAFSQAGAVLVIFVLSSILFEPSPEIIHPNVAVVKFSERRLQQRYLRCYVSHFISPAHREKLDRVSESFSQNTQFVKFFVLERKVDVRAAIADFF